MKSVDTRDRIQKQVSEYVAVDISQSLTGYMGTICTGQFSSTLRNKLYRTTLHGRRLDSVRTELVNVAVWGGV